MGIEFFDLKGYDDYGSEENDGRKSNTWGIPQENSQSEENKSTFENGWFYCSSVCGRRRMNDGRIPPNELVGWTQPANKCSIELI